MTAPIKDLFWRDRRVFLTGGTGLVGMWKAFDEMEQILRSVLTEAQTIL